MGIRGSPFWFGDPQIGLGIHLIQIPISLWGSPFWYGDSFDLHPHIGLGIPVLVWRFGYPRFGLGIPEPILGSPNRYGDSCNVHPHFGMGITEPIRGSPNQNGDPQTKMGCLLILSHSVQWCSLIYLSTD
jgi:hypothetical protein